MTVAEKKPEGDTAIDAEKEKAAKELLDELNSEEAAAETPSEKKKEEEPEDESAEEKAKTEGEGDKPAEAKGESEGTPTGAGDAKKKSKSGFNRRTSKLRKENEGLKGAVSQTEKELQAERDRRRLLELRVQQLETKKQQEITKPDPDQFDLGEDDPKFIEQQKAFDDSERRRLIREELAEVTKTQSEETSKQQAARALQEKQDKYWDLADEECPQDFRSKEDKVTELLGPDKVNMIIDNYPGESHKIVYYLGAPDNEEEAEEINELLENRNTYVQAVTKIGKILGKIEANLDFTIAPDPDEQSEGSAPTHTESLQMQLDKMRADLSKNYSNEGFSRMRKFRKKAKERGIILR